MATDGSGLPGSAVLETLAAAGAPLAGVRALATIPLEQALAAGLVLSRSDATLLRSLPVVLARAARALDWVAMERLAREADVLAVLGLVAELAGRLANLPELERRASTWWSPPSPTGSSSLRATSSTRSWPGKARPRSRRGGASCSTSERTPSAASSSGTLRRFDNAELTDFLRRVDRELAAPAVILLFS